MRSPLKGLPPCQVRGCARYAAKDLPGFCRRCWRLATTEEQAGLRFAYAAPFWPRMIRETGDASDYVLAGGAAYEVYADHGYLTIATPGASKGEWLGAALGRYERDTTMAALLAKVSKRRDALMFGGKADYGDGVEDEEGDATD